MTTASPMNAYHRQAARRALDWIAAGYSDTEIAEWVGVCRETVRQWRIRGVSFERRTAPQSKARNFHRSDSR